MDMDKRIGPACRQYEPLLDDYLCDRLDVASAAKAEKHLKICPSCRSAFDAARDGVHLFRVAGFVLDRAAEPSPAFSRHVMIHVGREKERRAAERLSYWQPFVSYAWRFAATAMVALMLLLTYAVRGRSRSREVVGPIGQQSQLVDVFSPDPTRTPANQDEVLIMVAESSHGTH